MEKKGQRKIIWFAALMSLGTMTSRILGLIRDISLSSFFPQTITDIFLVAFRLPQFFRRFLGEGALSQSFLPLFVGLKRESSQKALCFSASVLGFLLLISFSLSLLAVWKMEFLISLLTSEKSLSAEEIQRIVTVARILFPYLILIVSFSFYMSVLNSLKSFFLPGITPSFLNLGIIVFSFIAYLKKTLEPEFLALGVLIGGFFQAFFLVIAVKKKGFLVQPSLNFKTEGFKTFIKKLLPAIFGLGVLQILSLINLYFATYIGEGVVSFIYFGERILDLPRSLIAVSLGTALLPFLSNYYREPKKLTRVLQENLSLLFFLTLPASLGLYFLADPLVEVIFMRGFFGQEEVMQTSYVVKVYSPLLIVLSGSTLLASGFYSFRNTVYPSLCAFLTILGHWFLADFLVLSYGFEGLIVSSLISGCMNFCFLLLGFQILIGKFHYKKILKRFLGFIIPNLGLALVLYASQDLNVSLFSLLGRIFLSVVIYFLLSYIFKVDELRQILSKKHFRKPH